MEKSIFRPYSNLVDINSSNNRMFDNDVYSNMNSNNKDIRKISKVPFKVLDAPALQDDFYLNLIDWSVQNTLAVGLSSCVYLWSAHTGKVSKLCDLGAGDQVTSVSWA